MKILKHVNAGDFCIAYEERKNIDTTVVILMTDFLMTQGHTMK